MQKYIILPVVIYGCETWALTECQENRFRVVENKVLRKLFGLKEDEITGEYRILNNDELYSLYNRPSINRIIKSRRLGWAGHVFLLRYSVWESFYGYRSNLICP